MTRAAKRAVRRAQVRTLRRAQCLVEVAESLKVRADELYGGARRLLKRRDRRYGARAVLMARAHH